MIEHESQQRLYIIPPQSVRDRIVQKFYIRPEHIPYLVYPLVEFVNKESPDYIIALDSGGRIPGLAMHMLYQQLYGALPTQDHSIHFKKLSRKMPDSAVYQQLAPVVDYILSNRQKSHVFVLDDWINTGLTKQRVTQAFDDLSKGKVTVSYGVMRGWRGDISGDPFSFATTAWRDNSKKYGIIYENDAITPKILRTTEAISLREDIAAHIKVFAMALSLHR